MRKCAGDKWQESRRCANWRGTLRKQASLLISLATAPARPLSGLSDPLLAYYPTGWTSAMLMRPQGVGGAEAGAGAIRRESSSPAWGVSAVRAESQTFCGWSHLSLKLHFRYEKDYSLPVSASASTEISCRNILERLHYLPVSVLSPSQYCFYRISHNDIFWISFCCCCWWWWCVCEREREKCDICLLVFILLNGWIHKVSNVSLMVVVSSETELVHLP